MANIIECHDSRKGKEGSGKAEHTLRYLIWGVASEDEAWAVFLTNKPSTYRGNPFRSGSIDPQGCMTFFFEAEYSVGDSKDAENKEPKEKDESTFTFSTTGGTEHITVSKQTTTFNKAGAPVAPNFKSAIGVTKSGVEGVDIIVPKCSFKMTKIFDLAGAAAVLVQVLKLTGCVNSDAMTLEATVTGLTMSFEPGTLRFDGMDDFKERKDGLLTGVFNFSAEPNIVAADNLTIGDILITSKRGWDYLWVLYDETVSNNFAVRTPRAAYVEEVYRYRDLRLLGL